MRKPTCRLAFRQLSLAIAAVSRLSFAAEPEITGTKQVEASKESAETAPSTPEEMRKMYADLAARHPDDAAAQNRYGEYLWQVGEESAAEAQWRKAETINPKYAPALHHLGGIALSDGDPRKCAGYYRRAVEAEPLSSLYHLDLANLLLLFRQELTDDAHPTEAALIQQSLDHYAEAVRLSPENEICAKAHAETYFVIPAPDWRKALAAWEHYRDIATQKDLPWIALARVQMKLGDGNAALECLQHVQGEEFTNMKLLLSKMAEQLVRKAN